MFSSGLSSLAGSVLSKYLGSMVEGVEGIQADISNGKIELPNLKFKAEALRDLNLPIAVKEGFLGHLSVEIPWREIYSKSTTIVIQDVFMLVHPKSNAFDEEFSKREQVTKERFLQLREVMMTSAEDLEKQKQAELAGSTWTQRLIATAVNNIQVTVERIHIRYEDSVSVKGRTLCAGITLDGLGALSCDENFQLSFVSGIVSAIRKLCTLRNLSVYWDCDAQPLQYSNGEQFISAMRAQMHLDSNTELRLPQPQHQYILKPLCGGLRVMMNQDKADLSIPRIFLDASFEEVSVSLHERQFKDLLAISDGMASERRGLRYRKLRPQGKFNARFWWNFLIRATLEDVRSARQAWSWPRLQALGQDRKEYVRLWFLTKRCLALGAAMTEDDKRALAELDLRLDFDTIVSFRELGEALWELRRTEAVKREQEAQAQAGLIGRWWGTAQTEKRKVLDDVPVLSAGLLRELNEVQQHRAVPSDALPKDFVKMAIDFSLARGVLALRTYDGSVGVVSEFADLAFSKITAQVRARPTSSTISLEMASMVAAEFHTLGRRREFVRAADMLSPRALLSLSVDISPLDGLADTRVSLQTRSLDVEYSASFIDRLVVFFRNDSAVMDELLKGAQESVDSLQREVAVELKRSLAHPSENKVLDLNVVVEAPNVVFPASFTDPHCPRLIAVLGTFELHSNLDQQHASNSVTLGPDGKKHVAMDYFYQQSFRISANRLRLLMAHDENWRDYVERTPKCSLVEDLSVGMDLGVRTFPTAMLPKIKLSAGLLSSLKGNVSPSDLANVLRVIDSLVPKGAPPDSLSASSKKSARSSSKADKKRRLKSGGAVTAPSTAAASSDALTESSFDTSFLLEDLDASSLAAPSSPTTAANNTNNNNNNTSLLDEFSFDDTLKHVSDNPTAVEVLFNAGRVELSVYKRVSTLVCKDIVCVQLNSLEVTVSQRRDDLEVSVGIGQFGVEDCIVKNASQKWLLDGGISSREALLQVSYVGVPASSPRYEGCDTRLVIRQSSIVCDLNRETILYILDAVDSLAAAFKQPDHQKISSTDVSDSDVDVSLASSSSSSSLLSSTHSSEPPSPMAAVVAAVESDVGNHYLLQLTMHLGSLEVRLNRGTNRFCTALVSGANAEVDMKRNGYLRVDADVGTIDMRHDAAVPSAKWARVMHTERKAPKTLELTYEMFPAGSRVDNKVTLQMSSIQYVFRNVFLIEMAHYFSEMDEMKSYLFERAATTASSASKASGKMELNITINTPIVLVPCTSDSDELLAVNLGEITLWQEIETSASSATIMQVMSVDIKELSVRGGLRGVVEQDRYLLEDWNIRLLLNLPLDDVEHLEPNMGISCEISEFALTLREQQFPTIFSILSGNMCEKPAVSKEFIRQTVRLQQQQPLAVPALVPVPIAPPAAAAPVPAPPAPTASRNYETLNLSFKWEQFRFTLESASESSGLASFMIHNFDVKLVQRVDESMELVLTVESLSLMDKRVLAEQQSFFTRMIALDEEAADLSAGDLALGDKRFLFMEMSSRASAMEIKMSVCPITCYVVLPFVKEVLRWTTALQAQMNPALDALAKRGEEELVVPLPAEEAAAPSPPPSSNKLSCQIALRRIELVLPEHMEVATTRALGVRASFYLEYEAHGKEQSVQLDMLQVSLSKKRLATSYETLLMQPWTAGVSYLTKGSLITRIDIVLAALDVVFAHSDYELIMALLSQFTERDAHKIQMEEEKRQREATTVMLEPRRAETHHEPSLMELLTAGDLEEEIALSSHSEYILVAGPEERRDFSTLIYAVLVWTGSRVYVAEISYRARTDVDASALRFGPNKDWDWTCIECRKSSKKDGSWVLDFVVVRGCGQEGVQRVFADAYQGKSFQVWIEKFMRDSPPATLALTHNWGAFLDYWEEDPRVAFSRVENGALVTWDGATSAYIIRDGESKPCDLRDGVVRLKKPDHHVDYLTLVSGLNEWTHAPKERIVRPLQLEHRDMVPASDSRWILDENKIFLASSARQCAIGVLKYADLRSNAGLYVLDISQHSSGLSDWIFYRESANLVRAMNAIALGFHSVDVAPSSGSLVVLHQAAQLYAEQQVWVATAKPEDGEAATELTSNATRKTVTARPTSKGARPTSIVAASDVAAPAVAAAASQSSPLNLLHVETLSVVLKGFRARIIDDAAGELDPLLLVKVGNASVFLSSWSSAVSGVVELSLSMDYFNPMLQVWEPFLRASTGTGVACREGVWSVEVTLKTKDGALSVDTVALDPLDLTVTRAMMSSIRRVSESWSEPEEDRLRKLETSKSGSAGASSRYVIASVPTLLKSAHERTGREERKTHVVANFTGIPLRWSIGTHAPTLLPATKGSNCCLFRPKAKGHVKQRWNREHNALNVYLPNAAQPLLNGLPLDGTRCMNFRVDRIHIVYDLKYVEGLHVAELRSHMFLVSNMRKEVRVNLLRNDQAFGWLSNNNNNKDSTDTVGLPPILYDLSPGDRMSLPLDMAHLPWRLGPPASEQDSFEWSDLRIDEAFLEKESERTLNGVLRYARVVSCAPSSKERGSSHFSWSYAMSAAGVPDAFSNDVSWTIELAAPVTVRNLLNIDVRYRVVEMRSKNAGDSMEEGTLVRGEELEVYRYNPKGNTIGLSIMIEGFGWSDPFSLSEGYAGTISMADTNGALDITVDCVTEGVQHRMSLWVPFWLVNRTRMSVLFKSINRLGSMTAIAGQRVAEHDSWHGWKGPMTEWFSKEKDKEAIMFSQNRLSFVVGNSCDAPPLELASSSDAGVTEVTSNVDKRKYEVAVRVFTAPSVFWRTKIVQLDNHIQIVNKTDRTLLVTQKGTEYFTSIEPNAQIPWHWVDGSDPARCKLRVRFAGDTRGGWNWSGAFEVQGVSLFQVAVNHTAQAIRARLTVQTTTTEAITAVIVRPATKFSIYKIRNLTGIPLHVHQKDGPFGDGGEIIKPGESDVPWVWPEPAVDQPLVTVSIPNGAATFLHPDTNPKQALEQAARIAKERIKKPTQIVSDMGGALSHTREMFVGGMRPGGGAGDADHVPTYSLDTATEHPTLLAVRSKDGTLLSITPRVVMDGASKVLEFTQNSALPATGLGNDNGDDASTKAAKKEKPLFSASLQLQGVGLALIDGLPQEVFSVFLSDIRARYEDTAADTRILLDVKSIQADNMLYNSPFPLVLLPKNPPNKNFLHVVVNQAKGYSGISFFNGLSLDIQEAEIRIDEAFVTHMFVALEEVLQSREEDIDWNALARPVPDFGALAFSISDMVYARELNIGPILMGLSYTSCPWAAVPVKGDLGTRLHDWLNFVKEIEGVQLQLGCLEMRDVYHSRPALQQVLQDHYTQQVMSGFFRLLGAVPVLGAPPELFRGLTTGVRDAFFLPSQGITRSPADFGDGLRAGSSALFKGTFGTMAREVGKVTGRVTNYAAKLTFDADFQLERQKVAKRQAKNAGQGVVYAGRDVGKGILDGLSGIVMNPIKGAQRAGAGGFMRGIGTGLVGVVTKPVVGVLDAATQISNGIKNTGGGGHMRTRRPRHFDASGFVLPYNGKMAEAQELLHLIDSSVHSLSFALFHHPDLEAQEYRHPKRPVVMDRILISNKYVFRLHGKEITSIKVTWKVELRNVGSIIVRDSRSGPMLVLVDQERGIVCEMPFPSLEEAYFSYFKLYRILEADRSAESSLQKLRSTIPESTVNLIELLAQREQGDENPSRSQSNPMLGSRRNLLNTPSSNRIPIVDDALTRKDVGLNDGPRDSFGPGVIGLPSIDSNNNNNNNSIPPKDKEEEK